MTRKPLPPLHLLLEVILALGLPNDAARWLTRTDVDLQTGTVTIRPKVIDYTVLLPVCRLALARRMPAILARGGRPRQPRIPTDVPTAALAGAVWHRQAQVLELRYRGNWSPKGEHRGRVLPIPPAGMSVLQHLCALRLDTLYPGAELPRQRAELRLPEPELLLPGVEGGLIRDGLNDGVPLAPWRSSMRLSLVEISDVCRHHGETIAITKEAVLCRSSGWTMF